MDQRAVVDRSAHSPRAPSLLDCGVLLLLVPGGVRCYDAAADVLVVVAAVQWSTYLVSIDRRQPFHALRRLVSLCRERTALRCLAIYNTLSGGEPLGLRLNTPQRTPRNLSPFCRPRRPYSLDPRFYY